MLGLLEKVIKSYHFDKILDMGCGDGEYVYELYDRCKNKWFCGIDISEEMIKQAKSRCAELEHVNFEVSEKNVLKEKYDMAYTVSVLAHLSDADVFSLIENMCEQIKDDGVICIFEQVAPYEIEGNGWKRRTSEQYKNLLEKQGFELMESFCCRVDFAVHRILFERKIAKWFYKKYERQECNKNTVFLSLSSLFTFLSFRRKKKKLEGFGYVFLCAKKEVVSH